MVTVLALIPESLRGAGIFVILPVCIAFYLRQASGTIRRQQRLVEEAKRNGWVVPARIVDSGDYFKGQVSEGSGATGPYVRTLHVEYVVDGRTYRVRRTYGEGSMAKSYARQLYAYYDPAHPKRVVLSSDEVRTDRGARSCLTTILLFVALMATYMFIVYGLLG